MSICDAAAACCVSSSSSISRNPFLHFQFQSNPLSGFSHPPSLEITPIKKRISFIKCGIRELRQRIDSVKSTHKITEAMKLVAAARLQLEDVQVPLTEVRPVARVALVVVTGDKGLCGGFNNVILKKAEARINALKKLEAQAIADDVFSMFVSQEVDKVELLYTKFVSLVKSEPVIHTLLPLSSKGQVIDLNGNCVDAVDDEYFRLTTKGGKLSVERDVLRTEKAKFLPNMLFEQDPVQIIDALMPLYLNSQILKALQESLASELAARMGAMSNATDNANELKKNLSMAYNRERQAKITGEILEIVAGAEALR
ncbi:unnamed protein product [Rhodiola kirilowii]